MPRNSKLPLPPVAYAVNKRFLGRLQRNGQFFSVDRC